VKAVAPGEVVLSNTEIVLSPEFATIRSGLPSPFISAVLTETGPIARATPAKLREPLLKFLDAMLEARP
jgi:hypothetical protein